MMKKIIKKRPSAFLLLLCYGLWLAGLVLWHAASFAVNRIEYATGALQYGLLGVEDFELHELERNGEILLSIGADPQMRLLDETRRVENVRLDFVWYGEAGPVEAFWAKPGHGYSVRNMASVAGAKGSASIWLPAQGGQNLRIDPATLPGVQMEVRGIFVNEPRPFWAFFTLGSAECLLFAVVPGLLAAAARVFLAERRSGKEALADG